MNMAVRNPVPTSTSRVKFREQRRAGPPPPPEDPPARVTRVARLLALAHRIDGMIRSGELKNWAEAARVVGVTRARMTQIANLMLLAPEIQEAVLINCIYLTGDRPVSETSLRFVTAASGWKVQRNLRVDNTVA